jgi:hypothetical protein
VTALGSLVTENILNFKHLTLDCTINHSEPIVVMGVGC